MSNVKTISTPRRTIKFGRRRPVALAPRLSLGQFLRASLPPAPASGDYSAKAKAVLTDVMGNDQLGDCVVAGGYHVLGLETGNATGAAFHASSKQIIADYSAIGGYVPGDSSTDNGCDEETAQNYWQTHGFANGSKLLGWLSVDATNKAEVASALYLFENLFFGVELPDAWVNPFPEADGFTWDVAGDADPQNGHAFCGVGWDSLGVTIDTWGIFGKLTWAALAKYCSRGVAGQLFTWLSADQLAKGAAKAPNGFAWRDLIAAFDSIGGNVPIPAPEPPPPLPPPPTPVGPVTLAAAQAWVRDALMRAPHLLTRDHASALAAAALSLHWPK